EHDHPDAPAQTPHSKFAQIEAATPAVSRRMIGSLPQLIEEDMKQLSAVFDDYLVKSEADSVLLTAEGGFLVSTHGKTKNLDTTSIGALASNSFEANKAIASMIGESSFNSLYQAGDRYSLYVQSID